MQHSHGDALSVCPVTYCVKSCGGTVAVECEAEEQSDQVEALPLVLEGLQMAPSAPCPLGTFLPQQSAAGEL